jgi:phytoene dehydrogenase-like protein
MAAHSMLDLTQPATASFGLVLTLSAHAVGWPLARGGSGRIVEALGSYLEDLGGEIVTNRRVRSLEELPAARAVLLDLTPRQFLDLAGEALDARHQRPYQRYRYGPGVFKIDWALDGQIPWTAEVCSQSATVHVGGSMSEIVGAEKQVWRGEHPEKPFVLVVQQSAFDACRAPQGKHTAWAYCHVPHGSTVDMRPQIEAQIERFAPGFRERILAVHTRNAADMQAYNANYIGGDINGGVQDLLQMFTRPVPRWDPYRTPLHGVYLCSSATPPGGGVHGMSGYHAARSALRALNTPMTA